MKNIKIRVTPPEFREIQRIAFDNGIYWYHSSESKIKTSNILYIDDKLSWETPELAYSKNYEEVKADSFIRENTQFPVYKIQKEGLYVVKFSDINTGEVVWVNSECKTYKIGDSHSNGWSSFYRDCWKSVENIDLFFKAMDTIIEEQQDELNYKPITEYEESVKKENDIQPGTIVQATRKSISEKHEDYTWQGTYYGKFNEHYLLDFNGTSYRIADEIEIIPTLTKKEAKQKISELFSQPKNVTSEKIRNIIDLIKC